MLRYSLYKKFNKKSFQPGGTQDLNPRPKVVGQPDPTIMTRPLPEGFQSFEVDPNTVPSQDQLLTQPDQLTGGMQPINLDQPSSFAYEQQNYDPSQGLTIIDQQNPYPEEPNMFQKAWDYTKNNWQDMATTGLLGARAFLNYRDDIRKDRNLQQQIQRRGVAAKPLYDYNWMYGRTTSGGTEYQPTIMAQDGAQLNTRTPMKYQKGANVEIEGGEFLILPDGTTEVAQGPSHSNGGIDTVLPEGTKVYSNHLRPMDLHKMKAEDKAMLVNRYMQEGGDLSMGMGLDYLENYVTTDRKNKFKDTSEEEDIPYRKSDKTRTFAELAKRYDLKQFQEILDNPFAPAVDKQTAEILLRRNKQILDQLFRDQQILNGNSTGEPMPEQSQQSQQSQMRNGGVNNPGFRALPKDVQENILRNMEEGGFYMQDGANFQVTRKDGKYYDPVKKRYYNLPSNVEVKRGDDPNLEVGDYIVTENGTIRKVSSKDVKRIEKGFNRDFGTMKERFMDPELQDVRDAMYQKYLEKHKGTKISKEQFFNTYLKAQEQLYKIDEAVQKDPELAKSIKSEDYDKVSGGMKNKKYRELAEKLGMPPLEENEIGMFQAGYLDLADLQQDPQFKEKLQDFDLAPKGVMDETYLGKAISPEDAILGNTTIRQLQYLKDYEDQANLGYEDIGYLPEEIPPGGDYTTTETQVKRGEYEKMPYPAALDIPAMYQLGQETFPYAIPEVAAPYVRPQTLNIQSQLRDADNNAIAAMRYGADPNMAYIAGLDAKERAFQTKQNYDAEGRWKADLYNADAKFKADVYNADVFNQVYNDMYAGAKSAQGESREAALTNLVQNRAMWDQSETTKKFYLENFAPNFNATGRGDVTVNPQGSGKFYMPGSSTTTTTTTSSGSSSTSPSSSTAPGTQVGSPTAPPSSNTINVSDTTPSGPVTPPTTTGAPALNMQPTNASQVWDASQASSSMQRSSQAPQGPQPSVVLLPEQQEIFRQNQQMFAMGGEMENYLNPFKKKKKVRGFRKK